MHCPFCKALDTKVIDSRLIGEGDQIRRRRECPDCSERFTTFESAELILPQIIKRDGSRNAFDENKLRAGMLIALRKRPVSTEQIDAVVQRLIRRMRAAGEREINSQLLGAWVMEELYSLDKVAYVRFASVYRSFEDVDEFHQEIKRLQNPSHSN